jgi:hypothetical protein
MVTALTLALEKSNRGERRELIGCAGAGDTASND